MKLCIPSMLPGGLLAQVAEDFATAQCYTLVTIHEDGNKGAEVMHNHTPNDPTIAARLMGMGVSTVVTNKITLDALRFLWNCSIRAYLGAIGTVDDTVNTYRNGFLAEASEDNLVE